MGGQTVKSKIIANSIRQCIADETFGSRLPTMHELADRYDVNYKTVNKAVGLLVGEGLLETIKKKGTFVAGSGPRKHRDNGSGKPAESRLVALFVEDDGHVNEIIYGSLLSKLQAAGFMPLLISANQPLNPQQQIDRALALGVSLFVVNRHPVDFDFSYFRERVKDSDEIVFLLRMESDLEFAADYVLTDPWDGAYQATRHLIGQGHRRITLLINELCLPPELYRHSEHYQYIRGYKMAMEDSGSASWRGERGRVCD